MAEAGTDLAVVEHDPGGNRSPVATASFRNPPKSAVVTVEPAFTSTPATRPLRPSTTVSTSAPSLSGKRSRNVGYGAGMMAVEGKRGTVASYRPRRGSRPMVRPGRVGYCSDCQERSWHEGGAVVGVGSDCEGLALGSEDDLLVGH